MFAWFVFIILCVKVISSFVSITVPLMLNGNTLVGQLHYRKGEDLCGLVLAAVSNLGLRIPEDYVHVLSYTLDEIMKDPVFRNMLVVSQMDAVDFSFSQYQTISEHLPLFLSEYYPSENVSVVNFVSVSVLHNCWNVIEQHLLNSYYEETELPLVLLPDLARNSEKYRSISLNYGEEYRENTPFPYTVIDDLFPLDFIRQVVAEIPQHSPDNINYDKHWLQSNSMVQNKKLCCRKDDCMGPYIRHLISHLKSETFISFLESLTGINDLVADPKFFGAGLHQIQAGGHLSIHTDFTHHETLTALWRRVNVFVYLNEDWNTEEWGGSLELWDAADVSGPSRSIEPLMNRMVVFSTSNVSYHGHPTPLTCPVGVSRKSIALYYYTLTPPAVPYEVSGTRWFRPNEEQTYLERFL